MSPSNIWTIPQILALFGMTSRQRVAALLSGQNLNEGGVIEGGVIEGDAIKGGADERNPFRNPYKTDSFRLFQRVERQRSTQRSYRGQGTTPPLCGTTGLKSDLQNGTERHSPHDISTNGQQPTGSHQPPTTL